MTNPVVIVLNQSSSIKVVLGSDDVVFAVPSQSSSKLITGLTQRALLQIDTSNASINTINLPVFTSAKAARLGGLKRGDLYFNLDGRLQKVNRRLTNFFFNLSSSLTYIGKF